MREVTRLFQQLDQTTSTNKKVLALAEYFGRVGNSDKIWTIAMLSHRRPPRAVNYRLLSEWAAQCAGLPLWLFEESYHIVGDLAETIALLIPDQLSTEEKDPRGLSWYMEFMIHLKTCDDETKRDKVIEIWQSLNKQERFIFNKLITGGLRVGVSQKLMVRALAAYTSIDENKIALRLMGKWDPSEVTFESLLLDDNEEDDLSRPYPFYLAYALDAPVDQLGDIGDWQVERKWDGIRGQIIVRKQKLYVWSRGEELVTDKYPEFGPLAQLLPSGTVIDGEIIAYQSDHPMPFQALQKRIGRKNVSKAMLKDIPVKMIVYDMLEFEGVDVRDKPLEFRRAKLDEVLRIYPVRDILLLSEILIPRGWADLVIERENARQKHCEGLMLKRKSSPYQVGRKKGDWWKWKADPYAVDAVMIYAQRGHGRRANLFTDFTFGVWNSDGQLVSFAKAYSGLTDGEFEEITRWVRQNTIERFGPVSVVNPHHVFELHFEGIAKSSRHKSGIAVRFPRIHRWRKDKKPKDADTLDNLKSLLD